MITICPTVTAFDTHEYRQQIENIESFAKRIHIDLMDGVFAPTVSPALDRIWWPEHIVADIHLMYQKPMEHLAQLIKLKPNMVVIHAEADVSHAQFSKELHGHDIKVGIALLSDTPVNRIASYIADFDHVLIFSGHLGHHGGEANLDLLSKVVEIRALKQGVEISWDGGINDKNALELIHGGINVLNVGGFIQGSQNPGSAYAILESSTE
ncbi:MAG: hypothetical protein ABI354_03570 [Candidatus Saccharimonadales bacterium]